MATRITPPHTRLAEYAALFRPTGSAPTTSGWSDCRWGLHPLESAAFARRTRKPDAQGSAAVRAALNPFGVFDRHFRLAPPDPFCAPNKQDTPPGKLRGTIRF